MKLAFLGRAELRAHAPLSCGLAETTFFAEDWAAAQAWRPDASIVFVPELPGAEALRRIPGLKIAVIAGPLSDAERARLGALFAPDGFSWFTCPEAPPPGLDPARLLQILPLPIETSRLPAPDLGQWAVATTEAAQPPGPLLDRLRARAPVKLLAESAELASAGCLVHWSDGPLCVRDPWPLQAMARGLLLLCNQPFPAGWGIEPDDEYLYRPTPDGLLAALDEVLRIPQAVRPVRVRAWQKVREAFSAPTVFERMLYNARLTGSLRVP